MAGDDKAPAGTEEPLLSGQDIVTEQPPAATKFQIGTQVRATYQSAAQEKSSEQEKDDLLQHRERIGQIGIVVEAGPGGKKSEKGAGWQWVEFGDLAREEVREADLKPMIVAPNSKFFAEFLGTFMFVFVLGANLSAGLHDVGTDVFGPTAIGCCLMVMVYSLSPISGGHINPAVTLAVFLTKNGLGDKEFTFDMALKYWIAQGAGGSLAGVAVGFLTGFGTSAEAAEHAQIAGLGYAIGAPLAEFFYTFLLCFVFLNTSNGLIPGKKANRYYGVAVGFVLIAAHGCSQVSGAALNPAVSLGVNFMGPSWKSLDTPISIAAQLVAGVGAFIVLGIVRPEAAQKSSTAYTAKLDTVNKFLNKKLQENKYFDKDDSAEFLGTFFICLTISLNAMIPPEKNVTQLWSVAACYMVMIWTLGDVSGGVFNPALTLAFAIRWYNTKQGFASVAPGIQLPPEAEDGSDDVDHKLGDPNSPSGKKEFLKYSMLQLVGGACGTGATILIYMASGKWPAPHVGPLTHKNSTGGLVEYTDGQAFFAELCGTFLLAFVVLSVQNHALIKDYAALAIGGAVIASGYSFGPISGGFFNPSSTLACSIGRQLAVLTSVAPLMYLAAQLTGASLAAVVFKLATHQHEFDSADSLPQ
jgi:glycerol uptake facilitator-like aquaporin